MAEQEWHDDRPVTEEARILEVVEVGGEERRADPREPAAAGGVKCGGGEQSEERPNTERAEKERDQSLLPNDAAPVPKHEVSVTVGRFDLSS